MKENSHRHGRALRIPSFFLLALWTVLSSCLPSGADEIRSFSSDITINPDCSIEVKEHIFIDFGETRRHGIFRSIPIQYERFGNSYTVGFKLKEVIDQYRDHIPCTVSRQGTDINLKIGDPAKTMTGQNQYTIDYVVRRVINFPKGEPVLYWNVTGNEWPFKIDSATAVVHLPAAVKERNVPAACYFGEVGSRQPASFRREGDHIFFNSPVLAPSQGLTIVVGLPKDSVTPPSRLEDLDWFLADWWPAFVIPAFALLIMGLLYVQFGRDDDQDKPIAVEWNPPGDLTPAEVGTLVDEKCDIQDIVSTLIDLAARGYLKIRELETKEMLFFSTKDYELTRLRHDTGDLKAHEATFLNGLFVRGDSVSVSSLKERFYTELPILREQIYSALVSKGYFTGNPDSVRTSYLFFGIVVGICGFFLVDCHNAAFGVGLVLSAVIICLFAGAMPKRTAQGSKATRECLGFKRFVQMAEKERIRVLADKDPTIFGRLLPFAMVLGCADQWAHAFHDLMIAPPNWYQPVGYGPNYIFSPDIFVNDLGQSMSTMQRAFVSAPAASAASGGSGFSGGFSGGGFGGGGGGSW